ncbi:hypothetical protein EV193_105290 [Herbihabitans rhizosphaerae]|uniref:Uncharacterized protein n=1 Tax=Herbihabitans rhizosphaerae TaxID=1872711 RepID=A0A4Q7KQW9_9PSEU|nr:hypothetical protein [Herbihabitans rhizosphaerae]RZS37732.1 hypothetical protein EV193_105290 [Herbihabitans rhizosphaerae]
MDTDERWHWGRSEQDGRVHAFRGGGDTVETACADEVSSSDLIDTHFGVRCVHCLMTVGDQITNRVSA